MLIKLILSGYLTMVMPTQSPVSELTFKQWRLDSRIPAIQRLKDGVGGLTSLYTVEELEALLSPRKQCTLNGDCELLAQAIVYEARGESREGRMAVGRVVLNRVESNKYPNTVKEVLTQPHQFSYIRDMHKQSVPTKKDWERAYTEAYVLLNNKAPVDMEGVLWYHSNTVSPYWSREFERTASVGNHYFYK